MTSENARAIIEGFSKDQRMAFYNAISEGWKRYERILESGDYSELGVYADNTEKRLLYSAISYSLDSKLIQEAGFDTKSEKNNNSTKALISNKKYIIDVFAGGHENAEFQKDRFAKNASEDGQKYIIIEYFGNTKIGKFRNAKIKVPDTDGKIVYSENLVQL